MVIQANDSGLTKTYVPPKQEVHFGRLILGDLGTSRHFAGHIHWLLITAKPWDDTEVDLLYNGGAELPYPFDTR